MSSTDVNPAIAEPVSPTERRARGEAPHAPPQSSSGRKRQQAQWRRRDLAEERHAVPL